MIIAYVIWFLRSMLCMYVLYHLRFKVHCSQSEGNFRLSDDHVLKVGVAQSKWHIYYINKAY